METLAQWLKAHPQVDAEMFESNHQKKAGSGSQETVCGFCLARPIVTAVQELNESQVAKHLKLLSNLVANVDVFWMKSG